MKTQKSVQSKEELEILGSIQETLSVSKTRSNQIFKELKREMKEWGLSSLRETWEQEKPYYKKYGCCAFDCGFCDPNDKIEETEEVYLLERCKNCKQSKFILSQLYKDFCVGFCSKYDSIEKAWDNCDYGDQLLGLAEESSCRNKKFYLVNGLIFQEILKETIKEKVLFSALFKKAIETIIAYGKGEDVREEMKNLYKVLNKVPDEMWRKKRLTENETEIDLFDFNQSFASDIRHMTNAENFQTYSYDAIQGSLSYLFNHSFAENKSLTMKEMQKRIADICKEVYVDKKEFFYQLKMKPNL